MKSRLDVTMVKAHNRRLIFEEIAAGAPMSRAQIARMTRLSAGTVATILDELTHIGVIREVKETRQAGGSPVGRKPHRVEFLSRAKRILCVDLATKTPAYYVSDLSLAPESSRHFKESEAVGYETLLRQLLEDMRTSTDSFFPGDSMEEDVPPIIGIGVSVPGPYRPAEDRISCKLIPELNDIRLGALFREYFSCPILIDHDVKLALTTEVKSIPDHEQKTVISLFLGEGVGSAISINGTVLAGAHGFATEIGQVHVAEGGTLEEQISWSSFLTKLGVPCETRDAEDDTALLKELRHRYETQERVLTALLDRTIRAAAEATANVICLLNPHVVIVSGRYAVFGDDFVERLRLATEARLIDELKQGLTFVRSCYSEKGPIIGASLMVRSHWLDRQYGNIGTAGGASPSHVASPPARSLAREDHP